MHLGNLELDTSAEEKMKYVECNNVPVRILSYDIVQSTRWKEPRSLSAHVVVNLLDKEAALNPESWPNDMMVRPWRMRRPLSDEWNNV